MSSTSSQVVVFTLDDRRYGIALSEVQRVVRMVDVTPLPQAPAIVLGVVDLRGRVIPVLDLRLRLRLPARSVALADQLIITRTARRAVALAVDAATDVVEYTERQAIAVPDIVPGVDYIAGVVKLADGLVLIHDLDRFLSLDEEQALDRALR